MLLSSQDEAYNGEQRSLEQTCRCRLRESGNGAVARHTQSQDTHPEAERVQIEFLSKATAHRRLELGLTFCEEGLAIAHHAIAQAHPHLSEQEHRLIFVEITSGKDLADRVRAYLARRQR